MAKRLTDEQRKFILDNYDETSTIKLRDRFNERFGTEYKRSIFYKFTHDLGLNKHIQHRYTPEEEKFLEDNAPKMTRRDLTAEFNKRFGTCIKEDAIVMRCWQKNYKPMNDGKFKNGSVPWEKTAGGKDAYMATLPRAPMGKEYTYSDGRTYVLTESGRKPKHRVIWEEHFGKLEQGEVVIFADGDKENFSPDNLRKISNRDQATLNMNGWVGCTPLVDAGITWCKLKSLLERSIDVEKYL